MHPLLLLFALLPLRAQGEHEITLGGAFHQTRPAWAGPLNLGQVQTGGLLLDARQEINAWPGHAGLRLEQGANRHLRFEALGFGFQRAWREAPQRNQLTGYLGLDLRLEHLRGRPLDPAEQGRLVWVSDPVQGGGWTWQPYPLDLSHSEAWMLRPWIRAGFTVRGLWIPDPGFLLAGHSLVAWFTQGGPNVHPLTRIEASFPLWRQGGQGRTGLLRQMAPDFELSYQLGARF